MDNRQNVTLTVIIILLLGGLWLAYPDICSPDLDSQTYDEGMFITQGAYILKNRDYSLAIQHPPLAKILTGLPSLWINPETPDPTKVIDENLDADLENPVVNKYVTDSSPDQLAGNPYYIAYHYLYSYNRWDADELLGGGRRVIQLMHYALAFLLFLVVGKLFGRDAGVAAMLIALLDPNLTAHGHLCTTDLPAAFFSLLSFYVLLHILGKEKPALWLIAAWGITLGLMFATKFSTLLLIVVSILIFLFYKRERIGRAFSNLGLAVIAAILACLIIGGGSFAPYIKPFGQLIASLSKGRPSYLLGNYSDRGFPMYYFATLLFKMPTALLILSVIGIIATVRKLVKKIDLSPGVIAMFVIPALLLLSTIIFHGNNLGIRHILVIYPFLIGISASIFPSIPKLRGLTGVGIILVVLFLIESVPAQNDSIPFFNMPSRAKAMRGELVADSNIDWGQDLSRLKKFCGRNRIRHLNLKYFGNCDPEFYFDDIPGFRLDIIRPSGDDVPTEPGWYAISLQRLLKVRARSKGRARSLADDYWLSEMDSAIRVGGSFFVYHIEQVEN